MIDGPQVIVKIDSRRALPVLVCGNVWSAGHESYSPIAHLVQPIVKNKPALAHPQEQSVSLGQLLSRIQLDEFLALLPIALAWSWLKRGKVSRAFVEIGVFFGLIV